MKIINNYNKNQPTRQIKTITSDTKYNPFQNKNFNNHSKIPFKYRNLNTNCT